MNGLGVWGSSFAPGGSVDRLPSAGGGALIRSRLLDRLDAALAARVVLVTADAGYGKSTLLTQYAEERGHARAFAWCALEHRDRDWTRFLDSIVRAIRIDSPTFGASTLAQIAGRQGDAPRLEDAAEALIRDLRDDFARPRVVVFDDVHLVEGVPEVKHLLREFIVATPPGTSTVLMARRPLSIPLGRLRAAGQVVELSADDLRFTLSETTALMNAADGPPLDAALVKELQLRTEGWAACLQLARVATLERSPAYVRDFIKRMSGAEGHVYDYIAEEVIGDLPEELRRFLVGTSILEVVDPQLAAAATNQIAGACSELISAAVAQGLLGHAPPLGAEQVRAHPLVREFLALRLRREVPESEIREAHRRVAELVAGTDWQASAHHHLCAGERLKALRVLLDSFERILGSGAYLAAHETLGRIGSLDGSQALKTILASRIALQRGDHATAIRLAETAWTTGLEPTLAALNLATMRTVVGDLDGAMAIGAVLEDAKSDVRSQIGRAYRAMISTSVGSSVDAARASLTTLVGALEGGEGGEHFLGVALSNLAYVERARGDTVSSREHAARAVALLSSTSSTIECVSAQLAMAWTVAADGRLAAARSILDQASMAAPDGQHLEVAYEAGEVEAFFGSAARGIAWLDTAGDQVQGATDGGEQALVTRVVLLARAGDMESARADAGLLRHGATRSAVAFEVRRLAAEAYLAYLDQSPAVETLAGEVIRQASAQSAWLWRDFGVALLSGVNLPQRHRAIGALAIRNPSVLSMAAEPVLADIEALSAETFAAIETEAASKAQRWRDAIRLVLRLSLTRPGPRLASLLSICGEVEDVRLLRTLERSLRLPAGTYSRALSRRTASRVTIHDLGRLELRVGDRRIPAHQMRRKVLALLCYLVSRPQFTASREQVTDTLWPDLDPEDSTNSLNQTVYFLRRVIEPQFIEEHSPGYVRQDGDLIWLDSDLISARSRECLDLLRDPDTRSEAEATRRLVALYGGPFGLDFPYEDWAATYREHLRAAFLARVEAVARGSVPGLTPAARLDITRRAAEVEPESEALQVGLVRIYREQGADAAAREQYGQLVRLMREVGLEPPPFESL